MDTNQRSDKLFSQKDGTGQSRFLLDFLYDSIGAVTQTMVNTISYGTLSRGASHLDLIGF